MARHLILMKGEMASGASMKLPACLMTPRLEQAMRWSARCHHGQVRKVDDIPYFQHVAAVALVLAQAGFDEDVIIAGFLHDVVEDTDATLEDVAARFGPDVCEVVQCCSEVKTDAQGHKRPWIDRKRDHLAAVAGAPLAAQAVVLADKLHNLTSIEHDLREGRDVWSQFSADRKQVLWYNRAAIEACASDDPRIRALGSACREVLTRVEGIVRDLPGI
jgi:(p)ppGpp synthase/HD superfamily hydrolase